MSKPSTAKTARRKARKLAEEIDAARRRLRGLAQTRVSHGYISPRRCRARTAGYTGMLRGAGIHRRWFRYLIMRWTYTSVPPSLHNVVEHGGIVSTPVGYAWTKRQADRMVDALRRAE